MDFLDFLTPINIKKLHLEQIKGKYSLNSNTVKYIKSGYFPELNKINLAIIGVEEGRNSVGNENTGNAPDEIRKEFYRLYKGSFNLRIADLGNIKPGNSVNDTYVALSRIVSALLEKKIIPIIIGGSQDLSFAQYKGYEFLNKAIDCIIIDHEFDLGNLKETEVINSNNYLYKIITNHPNYLFNVSVIGYQTYFVYQPLLETFEKLNFDSYRLGEVRSNIEDIEPVIRCADMISFDIASIKMADAPASYQPNVNGFYGEEACRITRYAGMSDKLTSIGFYNMNPEFDNRNQTASLISQMMWYFIEGYYNRKNDLPEISKKNFTKYITAFEKHNQELVFFKSNKTNRWWMEVPSKNNEKENKKIIPCSYKDYEAACNQELPNKWWQAFNKLN